MITTKHLIETQIPYHIRESNPLFIKFLEYYYEFQEYSKLTEIIQDVLNVGNYDLTEEYFLNNLFEELKILPNDIYANKRLIANHIYDVYKSKGTHDGIRLLIKIITNVDSIINLPYDNVLKASDGIWSQENFITSSTFLGTVPVNVDSIQIKTNDIINNVFVTRQEVIDQSTVRFYYKPNKDIHPSLNDFIYIRNDSNILYQGKVDLSPNRIHVQTGGKNWQLGQVIVFPGNGKDTIAKVSKLGINGSIEKLDIIQYGYGHSVNASLDISPYGARPLNARYTIDYVVTAPNVKTYTLKIYDGTIGSNETIIGIESGLSADPYFLSDYNLTNDYNGNVVLSVQNSSSIDTSDNSSITIEEWLESKATLILVFDTYSKLPGKWLNDNSQLSNEYTVLQDNRYYQLNSYEIESIAEPSTYMSTALLAHPAGIALYTKQILTDKINRTTNITSSVS